jgi:hypothetical protein
MKFYKFIFIHFIFIYAWIGIRTRVICLEGRDSATELSTHEIIRKHGVLKIIINEDSKMPKKGFEPLTYCLGGSRSIPD